MSYIGKVEYCNYILKEYENKLSIIKNTFDNQVDLTSKMVATGCSDEQLKQAQSVTIDVEKEHEHIARITFQRLKQFITEGEKHEN